METKEWQHILPQWNEYAGEQFGEFISFRHCIALHLSHFPPFILAVDRQQDEDEDEDSKDSRKQRRKKDEYPLDLDANGLPIIPAVDDLNLESKKSLIRTFLTRHYSKFSSSLIPLTNNRINDYNSGFCCQKDKATVPWSAVRDGQHDFIDSEFLPTGQKIKDPSKLQSLEADRLLDFWYDRQKNKLQPTFEFKAWQNHEKEMKEPVKRSDEPREDSDISRAPTPATKRTRRSTEKVTKNTARKKAVRVQESDSDHDDEDDEDEDEDDDDDDDDDDDEEDDNSDESGEDSDAGEGNSPVKRPTAKSTTRKATTNASKRRRAGPAESEHASDPEEPQRPAKKLKRMVSHLQPVGHSRLGNPSSTRSFGPASGIQTRAGRKKQDIPQDAPNATGSRAKASRGKEKQVSKPAVKRSNRTARK